MDAKARLGALARAGDGTPDAEAAMRCEGQTQTKASASNQIADFPILTELGKGRRTKLSTSLTRRRIRRISPSTAFRCPRVTVCFSTLLQSRSKMVLPRERYDS
jgi:hypothetical protein